MRPFNAVARTEIANEIDKLRKSVLLMETTDELKTLHENIAKMEIAKTKSRLAKIDFWTINVNSFILGVAFAVVMYRLYNGVWF